jgi:DNA-binding GntR family transcriptional regulator
MSQQLPEAEDLAQQPRDATDAQYALIRKQLAEGQFPPGSPLLETALSVRYGVSRTPVREALARLAQDGLIERSTRGFRVRARTPQEIVDIYDARIALETTSAALAAERRSEFDVARLTRLLDDRRRATDATTFGALNNAWHDAIRAAAHNQTITDLLERLDALLQIYRSKRQPTAADRSVDDHDAILAAVVGRDAAAAEAAMRDHLRHMRDRRVENLLDEQV